MAPHGGWLSPDRGAAGRPGASRRRRHDGRDAPGPGVPPPADPIEAARAVLQAALDEIDAEVTKADEVLKAAGERTTLLVEQKLAALA